MGTPDDLAQFHREERHGKLDPPWESLSPQEGPKELRRRLSAFFPNQTGLDEECFGHVSGRCLGMMPDVTLLGHVFTRVTNLPSWRLTLSSHKKVDLFFYSSPQRL